MDIYRKPTNADITTQYTSNHPQDHKQATFTFYINRMLTLPITDQAKKKEWEKILNVAQKKMLIKGPTRCNSMQTFIYCRVTLHVLGVTHPSSGVLKTVSATSGVCHGNGTVTSFHRGLIRIGVSESCGMYS